MNTTVKLKTPMLEDLIIEWEKDSQVDRTEPGREIVQIPVLHNKYNKYLTLHRLAAKKAEISLGRARKLKWLYYTGKLTREELDKYGWEPFSFVLKSDLALFFEGDEDLIELNSKKTYHDECANFCVNVMKELNNRTWQLKEFMGWEKFNHGQH